MPNQHTTTTYRLQAIDHEANKYIDETFDTMSDVIRSDYGVKFNLTNHNVKHLVRGTLGHNMRLKMRHIIITAQSNQTQKVP